jgi:hypothetical protein
MARQTYSVLIYGAAGVSALVDLAPPAGFKWVIRDIQAYCNAGLSGSRFTFEGADGQAAVSFVWPPNTTEGFQWSGRIVVESGQTVHLHADDPTDVTISGYALTLP